MGVYDLTEEQLLQLKQNYLDQVLYETKNRGASYSELASADEIVSDDEIYEEYGGFTFSEEDFCL